MPSYLLSGNRPQSVSLLSKGKRLSQFTFSPKWNGFHGVWETFLGPAIIRLLAWWVATATVANISDYKTRMEFCHCLYWHSHKVNIDISRKWFFFRLVRRFGRENQIEMVYKLLEKYSNCFIEELTLIPNDKIILKIGSMAKFAQINFWLLSLKWHWNRIGAFSVAFRLKFEVPFLWVPSDPSAGKMYAYNCIIASTQWFEIETRITKNMVRFVGIG